MTISEIKAANAAAGYYFFSHETMRSFGSRVSDDVIQECLFITSERDRMGHAWNGARRYTVRRFDPETGSIETVSEFGQFATLAAAKRWAHNYNLNA